MSKSIVTPVGRASFPHLDKPGIYGKYTLTLLLPKNDPKVTEFVRWLGKAVNEEALAVAGQAGLQQAMQYFEAFKDGDKTASFKTYRAEYAGHWVLTMGRKQEFGKPCVVNRHRQPIDGTEVYAGCNALAFIDVFGYKYGAKKSVAIGFQHVMKVSDNAKFASTGIDADKAFGDLDLPAEDVAEGVGASPFGGVPTPAVNTPQPKTQPTTAGPSNPFAGF